MRWANIFICGKFLVDAACQKLLKSASVSQNYSKNTMSCGFTLAGSLYKVVDELEAAGCK